MKTYLIELMKNMVKLSLVFLFIISLIIVTSVVGTAFGANFGLLALFVYAVIGFSIMFTPIPKIRRRR